MGLAHISIDQLIVSPANMRGGRRKPDISDILPSVKARGVLTPLIVRKSGDDGLYEIVAGKRRYHAAKAAGLETPLPCAIMADGDDAAAIEASIIENLARLDPDPMTEFEAFARLSKAGRTVADIAATFGVSEQRVSQRLALGTLNPKLRDAFRAGDIDAGEARSLTLATPRQQKDWLQAFADDPHGAPRGRALRRWLLGGAEIAVEAALFDLADYPGRIIGDLFGESRVFDDAGAFWRLQNAAIARLRERYLADGWAGVDILPPDTHDEPWRHVETAKEDGGRVVIDVRANGEVMIHEGRLPQSGARRAQGGNETPPPQARKGELTQRLHGYCALHRRAMVRAGLVAAPGIALRLALAHMLAGSGHWRVAAAEAPHGAEIEASVNESAAHKAYETARERAAVLLDLPFTPDQFAVPHAGEDALCGHFARLLTLSDADVLAILSTVMAETLEAGGAGAEAAGLALGIDPALWWTGDAVFAPLLREREAMLAIIGELGGKGAAAANVAEKRKTLLAVIEAYLTGEGRKRAEGWTPGYLAFPFRAYTDAPPCSLARASRIAQDALAGLEPKCPPDEDAETETPAQAAE